MIERVGANQTYDYPKVNGPRNAAQENGGEKFSLDYDDLGVVYEPENRANQVKKQTAEETPGVLLSLSETAQKEEAIAESTFSLNGLRDWWQKAVQAMKAAWEKIWNSPAPGVDTDAQATVDTQVADAAQEVREAQEAQAASTAQTAQSFAAAKAQAAEFLAQSAGKQPVRRSDLLTYYDKHGTIVDVDASDRQRILYGDRSQLKG